MTDSVPGADAATPLSTTPAPAAPQADAPVAQPRSGRPRRGGRARKSADAAAPAQAPQRRAQRPVPPALEKLAELYPQLFGATFLPLKRGIFQDLLAAHPEAFEREALKAALGIHTRSTRYLQCVAAGLQRHDLQGQPVEPMAPEHVHHALLETYRRRQGRGPDDLAAKLRARIVRNFEASGLTREEYAERVRTRDEAANALLDEAFAELAERSARDEALLRAFEASGQSLEAFADMYGMDPRTVTRTLAGARQRRAVAAPGV
ncbi:ProQ/FINO family protein [Simplicispira lacusdiani]|uniref:ProQ/FINO family protein n=1 Tax=Simplicispira lacusdiani TaxID=2213010 RepID=UPI000E74DB78|nr:ProQ/FINO family protein [Simplicispira lacusdiani]